MRYGVTMIASIMASIFLLTTAGTPLVAQGREGRGPAHMGGKPADTPPAPRTQSQRPEPKGNAGGNRHTTTGSKSTTTTSKTTTSTATTTTTVTTTTPTTNPVKNVQLEQKLKVLLPAGTDVTNAAKGFKNWGQFV